MAPNQELFTLRELVSIGVGEHTLRRWQKEGFLKPSAFCGKTPKFKRKDFDIACNLSLNAEQIKINNLFIKDYKKKKPIKITSFYDELERKHIKKAR